ncbi:hypothetical protein VB739_01725 [Cyanobium gracile UHCC 0281]|uniref:Uncharacterized protein n=1 Tax=Cyanobium gracile UHCC 0281 TaxID=3110309 RepID=A0ABU5SRX8_9CYAN|nr:hypothetical protein [Cyanobium gracile UHCC 0281]
MYECTHSEGEAALINTHGDDGTVIDLYVGVMNGVHEIRRPHISHGEQGSRISKQSGIFMAWSRLDAVCWSGNCIAPMHGSLAEQKHAVFRD